LLKKSSKLKAALHGAKALRKGLLLPSCLLDSAEVRNQVFFGFDEVWFFPTDKIKPKPESAWIVGPSRIDQAKLDKLGTWMTENDCSLALGDGDGLNVIVKSHGFAKHVIAHSMSQPEPTLSKSGFWKEDVEDQRPAHSAGSMVADMDPLQRGSR
jgi:hypothetical protein